MKNLVLLSLALLSVTSFAKKDQRQEQPAPAVSFDDIRGACQNPAKYHNQVAPTNIQVSCKEYQFKWIPDTDGSLQMPTARHITASVYSDKMNVAPVTLPMKSDSQAVACAQFKQVLQAVETVRAVSCDEVIAYKGSVGDFCAGTVDSLKEANREAVTITPTGKSFSLCANGQSNQGQH